MTVAMIIMMVIWMIMMIEITLGRISLEKLFFHKSRWE